MTRCALCNKPTKRQPHCLKCSRLIKLNLRKPVEGKRP